MTHHSEAKQLETQLCLSRKDGGIEQAFCVVESAERKAMKAAMMCMYWLAKQEIPPQLTYLTDLGNAHYTSERFMQEAITSLGEVII